MKGFACLGGEKCTVCCRAAELFVLIGAIVFVVLSTGNHRFEHTMGVVIVWLEEVGCFGSV